MISCTIQQRVRFWLGAMPDSGTMDVKISVSFRSETGLDGRGKMPDFPFSEVRAWICNEIDVHRIVNESEAEKINAAFPESNLLRLPYEATLENLARYLGEVVCPSLLRETRCIGVEVEDEWVGEIATWLLDYEE